MHRQIMVSLRLQAFCLHLVLAALIANPGHALLNDGTHAASSTAHWLTCTPDHIVQGLTKNVTLRCDYDGRGQSELAEVSRVRMSKKSGSTWVLLAELRDNEATPRVHVDAIVKAKIGREVPNTFLEITWPVASQDIFGSYRCDFIGFDWSTFSSAAETKTLTLSTDTLTDGDMMDMFRETKDELSALEEHENQLDSNVTSLTAMMAVLTNKVDSLENKLDSLSSEQASLGKKQDSFMEMVKSKFEELDSVDPRVTWPTGPFGLLKPSTGCPAWSDLSVGFYKIHTESSSGPGNGNDHTAVLAQSTISVEHSQNMMTLEFCETGLRNSGLGWPQGCYCINCFNCSDQEKENECPLGFDKGYVRLDSEDTNERTEYKTTALAGTNLYFCCKASQNPVEPMVLPTERPFVLYRNGGQCQEVLGMDVSEETIWIDTEDNGNVDSKIFDREDFLDVDLDEHKPAVFHLCYYTKAQ